ncbi:CgeB family protein [Terriglobus aquaticus]|uniref:Glycosyltransferase n=1 Tax=Terriglobus aquaticus TaxID=940139 RepID=A0ABW9KQT2_9BACT|nr:glycosyltransferase [Terriglobus aquaticus]
MKIVILGLSITSSWGNGHATTFRALCRELHRRGHSITFIEKDVEWYRSNRDLPEPPYVKLWLYEDWQRDGIGTVRDAIRDADSIVVGSYFPDAIAATALLQQEAKAPVLFYDIDTPITIAALRLHGQCEYLRAQDIPFYAAYLSFTGGPTLMEIEQRFGSPRAVPFYCSVDPEAYHRTAVQPEFACTMSYLGTYAADRQPKLMELLNAPAAALPGERFLVAGPMYPADTQWTRNVVTHPHLPPSDHPALYSSSRWVLNLTRADMVAAGYSPSVRLFEASACGAPILSDAWPGMDEFFAPGKEILLASSTDQALSILRNFDEAEARRIGEAARERTLAKHTSARRAEEFEQVMNGITSATT